MNPTLSIISPAAAKTDADARNVALSNARILNKLGANMNFNRWIRCFAQNLPAIWKEPDVLDIPKHSKPALVIGAGPSLRKFRHLEQFAGHQANFDGYVFACDKSLKPALAAGIKPDFVINVDSSEECLKFVEGVRPDNSMSLILAATVNPSFRAAWLGRAYWFVPDIETCKHQFGVAQVLSEISGKTLLSTGGNAGTTALMAAFSTGARPICLSSKATVVTPNGPQAIRDIQVGTSIATPHGWRQVALIMPAGLKPLLEIVTSSRKLKLTADHKLLTLHASTKQFLRLTERGRHELKRMIRAQNRTIRQMSAVAHVDESHVGYWLAGRKSLNIDAILKVLVELNLVFDSSWFFDHSYRQYKGHILSHKKALNLAWESASSLRVGDLIIVQNGSLPESGTINPELAWLVGLYCGDGSSYLARAKYGVGHSYRIVFCIPSTEKTLRRRLGSVIRRKFAVPFTLMDTDVRIYRKAVYEFFNSFNLANVKSPSRRVPAAIWKLNKQAKLSFLAGCLDSDGSVDSTGATFISSSEKLCQDVRLLCIHLGLKVENIKSCRSVAHEYRGRRVKENISYSFRIQPHSCLEIPSTKIQGSKTPCKRHTVYSFGVSHRLTIPQFCAIDRIREIRKIPKMEEAIDVQLLGEPEFFANGVLTHNCLIGMDMSYDVDEPLESTPYWNTIQGAMGNAAAFFARRMNPFWKNEYYIDYIFDAYRELFLERANMLKMDVINCSGQGALHPNAVHGDAVRCMNFDDFLLKYA